MINLIKYLVFENSFRKFLIVMFFMFSMTSFGQSTESNSLVENNETTAVSNSNREDASRSYNYEFVLWFMGSKQDPNNMNSTDFNSDKINTKNQILTSGLQPNRLLLKAFLKKAVNFETCFS